MRTKKWLGHTTCDICNKECAEVGKHLFDTPTIFRGNWAVTCDRCHAKVGSSKKVGQVYDAKTLVKIADLMSI